MYMPSLALQIGKYQILALGRHFWATSLEQMHKFGCNLAHAFIEVPICNNVASFHF